MVFVINAQKAGRGDHESAEICSELARVSVLFAISAVEHRSNQAIHVARQWLSRKTVARRRAVSRGKNRIWL